MNTRLRATARQVAYGLSSGACREMEATKQRKTLVALVAVALAAPPLHAQIVVEGPRQDRLLTQDFSEVYSSGGADAPEWARFTSPGDMAFDWMGNLYVLDATAAHVVKIDSMGRLVTTIGTIDRGEGLLPGKLDDPIGLIVWSDGRLAVVEAGIPRLRLFDAGGEYQRDVLWNLHQDILPAGFNPAERVMRLANYSGSLYAQGKVGELDVLAAAIEFRTGEWPREPFEGVDDRGIERLNLTGRFVTGQVVLRLGPAKPDKPDSGLVWDVLPDGAIAYADPNATNYTIRILGGALSRGSIQERPLATPEGPVIRAMRSGWYGDLWVQRNGTYQRDDDGAIDHYGANRLYCGTLPAGTKMPDAFGPNGFLAYWESDEMDNLVITVRKGPTGREPRCLGSRPPDGPTLLSLRSTPREKTR